MSNNTNAKKYRNIIYLIIGILAAFILAQMEIFDIFLNKIRQVNFLDAFIGGVLYTLTFTFAVGGLILVSAEESLNPFLVSFVGAFGALFMDFLMFKVVRDNIGSQAKYLCEGPKKGYVSRLLCHDYFRWMLPLIGALIIASPIPDEFGVSLIGISEMSTRNFILVSYVFNFLGILALTSAIKFVF